MNRRSLRFRITAMVTSTFALVLIITSLIFVRWFDDKLVAEVRANDSEELDRQLEVLRTLDELDAVDPEFIEDDEILDPGPEVAGFPVALIPDDGTVISIRNAEGLLLGDSNSSLLLVSSSSAGGEGEDLTFDGYTLTPPEIQTALDDMPALVATLPGELSPAVGDEFALALQFLAESFDDPQVQETIETDLASAGLSLSMNDLFFGRGQRSAAAEGRVIETTRDATITGIPIVVTATSRVTSIDAAVGGVTKTLWIAVPALVLLAAAMTYLATGRALQPVHAISRQVETISSARTGGRVPEPDSGDEINHLAITMNGMLDRLEASAESQRRFVSDVSHELRTPATVIRAEVEAGLAEPENDWPKTAESVLSEQARLSDLVDDLLLLSRMDEGTPVPRVDLDLDAIVQEEAGRGWPHPVSTKDVEPVRIRGDQRQVQTLVRNLVANANRHATSRVEISLRHDGLHGVLVVDDDGAGVPAKDREKIFDRFTRLDESRERDSGGSGLGLAIVREVAKAHDGDAICTNSPLGGARFEVRLAV